MLDVSSLKWLLLLATLLPLFSFAFILCAYPRIGKAFGSGSWIATGAILASLILSFTSLGIWLQHHWPARGHGEEHAGGHARVIEEDRTTPTASLVSFKEENESSEESGSGEGSSSADSENDKAKDHGHGHEQEKTAYTGDYYLLGQFGKLRLTISYYIDTLTICMFCMVTLIASCIHFYAIGYMHEELHEVTDHEVTTGDGSHLHRPGRYFRFFQYLSLFCFSMLGLVLAGNIAMVFVFWELVGICSYFLIGFYIERKSASNAANKAFIVNRVGDFGMIIGLMALWSGCGTFAFGDIDYDADGSFHDTAEVTEVGIFSQVRPTPKKSHEDHESQEHHGQENHGEHGHELHAYALTVPEGMVRYAAQREIDAVYEDYWKQYPDDPEQVQMASESEIASRIDGKWRDEGFGYGLLIIAGIGIFCGCVGKSAQFPLHTWLPDAMEGPTPVSALVHSATMVAAGVYLVGRFYPVFAPEVLLVIAVIGCITLFMAATIAITATDIKRVLAYSTVSQLGYMMLALGVGGWVAGLMHLITHAFFKSLLFMCSGSVIHAVHTNEMPQMGGLLKKMPVTGFTMLVGCLAIIGASVPLVVGLSGYYSKDAILEQAWSFMESNFVESRNAPWAPAFFGMAAGGAVITAFYMFRMWFLTFLGKPRDAHRYDHAHESPPVMYVPLVILSVFAISVAWSPEPVKFLGGLPSGLIGALICLLITGGAALWFRASAEQSDHPPVNKNLLYVPAALSGLLLVVTIIWWAADDLHDLTLGNLLEQARHPGTAPHGDHGTFPAAGKAQLMTLDVPNEHYIHSDQFAKKAFVTMIAFFAGVGGVGLAAAFYWFKWLDPVDARNQFKSVHRFLINKWWFDELYDFLFVRPAHVLARLAANFDKRVLDRLIDSLAWGVRVFSNAWEKVADQTIVDGFVNLFASWTYSIGVALRQVQRGRLREYVMFIVLGTVVLFVLISFL